MKGAEIIKELDNLYFDLTIIIISKNLIFKAANFFLINLISSNYYYLI